MIRIVITGSAGKMGGAILRLAQQDKDIAVTGLTETVGHPSVGKNLPETFGSGQAPLAVTDNLEKVIDGCDVVIDFTSPAATLEHLKIVRSRGKAIVIGTTGFAPEDRTSIESIKEARVVISPNMSVGVNVMFNIVEKLSAVLSDAYDIEITEMHHRWKKDAPSGTALRLKEYIEKAQPSRTWTEVFGREGITGERKADEIGIMSIRGGDIVGEHTVTFAGIGERLEITHRAYTRDNFARGALFAAKWIVHQKEGIYSMKEVLGL